MADERSPFDGGLYHYAKLGGPDPEAHDDPVVPGESDPVTDADRQSRRSMPPPRRGRQTGSAKPRGRSLDRVVGILIGLVLGIGIVTAFVFLGSEDTIDAPRVQNGIQHERGAGNR